MESERKGGMEGDTQASFLGKQMVSFAQIENIRGTADYQERY